MTNQALLLLNMGGPNNIEEVELFLRNMFADKNILNMNPYMRKFIANIIISKRLEDVKNNYGLLGGKSPLPELTQVLIDKLKKEIDMPIYAAMRYVPPFALTALEKCKEDGIDELILFPMYPQYSTTTTLSSLEDIQIRCEEINYNPKIRLIDPYYDDIDYIEASCEKIVEATKDVDREDYDLLLSAHGLPLSIIKAGDVYQNQVEGNVSAIKTYLKLKGIEFNNIKLVYQSKVGSSSWLEPNLIDVLRNPTHRKVVIYPLAFTIDNSETVFELDIEHREVADKLKYDDYIVAKCMNDSDKFINLIVDRVNACSV
ncbi:Ferrochelatase, protoheme ferro-lyase [hydrothermal vent metagenome]|uniref:Ferrochelatase, protoheme ferro-lyase n=1 Tax=hydrothermal vent metagenome TaxID=652676 RepID=A0A1W1EG02_9ZZZZ